METQGLDAYYSITELGELMIRKKGIHEGLFDIAVRFQLAVGAVGPSPDAILPGAMIGVDGFGLRKVDHMGPLTIDAAKVNPKPVSRKQPQRK